jgi:hypothetical protein
MSNYSQSAALPVALLLPLLPQESPHKMGLVGSMYDSGLLHMLGPCCVCRAVTGPTSTAPATSTIHYQNLIKLVQITATSSAGTDQAIINSRTIKLSQVMANSIFAIRTIRPVANRVGLIQRSSFHSTVPVSVRVGDRIPDTDVLVEGSPGNKINLAQEIRGKRSLIIGVPAAFSELSCLPNVPAPKGGSYCCTPRTSVDMLQP